MNVISGIKAKIFEKITSPIGTTNTRFREAWLEKTLKKLPKGLTILDAGAGELKYKPYCSHLRYTSQDFGQYDGKGNHEGMQTSSWDNSKLDIVSDITAIPVGAGTFDAIMCIEVLEHVPEPVKAIQEFSRILKPDGKLIITAPICSLTHYAPYFFQTGLSKYWYQYVLEKNGFNILELTFNGNYFEYLAQELRRMEIFQHRHSKSAYKTNWLFAIARLIVLRTLHQFSTHSQNTEEILSYGIHVVAKKQNRAKN